MSALLTAISPGLAQYLAHGRCSKTSSSVDELLWPKITSVLGEFCLRALGEVAD